MRVFDAGIFSQWLRQMRSQLRHDKPADVPCGTCTACCTSGYFIHVRPEEKAALARIPKKLLVAAPGLPKGHMLMGHYENGHCPMLVEGKCSIYEQRPQACRVYDCRVFAAAGILPGGDERAEINLRVKGWRFSYPTPDDKALHAAVKAAAKALQKGPEPPSQPSGVALGALDRYPEHL